MSVYDLNPQEYNRELAEALRKMQEFKAPEWTMFVKTGVSRQRPPAEEDWWHKRAASILRQIYLNNIVGVGRLRTRYGSRYNRGMKPEIFKKASGKIIRTILQQAEAAGFIEKVKTTRRSGRQMTKKGKDFLDSIKTESKAEAERKIEGER